MLMQVETFEQTEVTAGEIEESDRSKEALEIIEKLGLKGQERMVTKRESGTAVRSPYRQMTREELEVYSALFPEHVEAEDYDSAPIPLRVLQVLAHAKDAELFRRIEVWGERTAPTDPILVGINYRNGNSWDREHHILARWGTALESFQVLRAKAKKVILDNLRDKAMKKKAECEMILSSLEAYAEGQIKGDPMLISL